MSSTSMDIVNLDNSPFSLIWRSINRLLISSGIFQDKRNSTLLWTMIPLRWSHLHLRSFEGVLIFFPGTPNYTFGKYIRLSTKVYPVEIGMVACTIPPATFVGDGTRLTITFIIVLVLGRKRRALMEKQRVAWGKYTTIMTLIHNDVASTS